jgi:hypothetical protein
LIEKQIKFWWRFNTEENESGECVAMAFTLSPPNEVRYSEGEAVA